METIIKIDNTELKASFTLDRHKGSKPRSASSNQLLYPFLFWLFEENEKLSALQRLHDGQIEKLIRTEYREYPETLRVIDECRVSRIAIWRSTYNRGLLSGTPKLCSFRYNDNGKAVDGQTGSKLLTALEQKTICSKYSIRDKRFQ